jgi:SAM-dependent methyltransferase
MKLGEVHPVSPAEDFGELQEAFQHPIFRDASPERRAELMLASSEAKYQSENAYPWEHYFGTELAPRLEGGTALDLGCFNGGRGAAWFERYRLRRLEGIDVGETLIEAATQYARHRGIDAGYQLAKGEELPYEDGRFDAILTYDVFEHVQNLGLTLGECWRVLKPGGHLLAVFPSYYQPIEHHLSLVTRTPAVHYFFGARTLIRAYWEILQERGDEAAWYGRSSPEPLPWERCNTINGTTLAAFRRLLGDGRWDVEWFGRKPIGSIGRGAQDRLWPKLIAALAYPLTYVPGLQECVLHRITYILRKNA